MAKVFWIALSAVAILGIGALMVVSGGRTPSTLSSSVDVSTSTIALETDTYKIDIAYPKFGNSVADTQTQVIAENAVNEFKEYPPNPTPTAAKNEMIGLYRDAYAGDDLYSARMDIYQYTGGAHGGTTAYGLNYHVDGSAYTLDEALALIGQSIEQVAERASAELTEQFDIVQFPEGATPTPQNYGTFVIGKDAVTFVFQQYQVQAYAAGMPEIVFQRVK